MIALSFEHLTQESTTAYKTVRITGNTFKTMVQMSNFTQPYIIILSNSSVFMTWWEKQIHILNLLFRPGDLSHNHWLPDYTGIDNGTKPNNVYK